jgi:hypothetical protein
MGIIENQKVCSWLIMFTSKFGKVSKFIYYPLLGRFREFGRLCRLRLGKVPFEAQKAFNRVKSG